MAKNTGIAKNHDELKTSRYQKSVQRKPSKPKLAPSDRAGLTAKETVRGIEITQVIQ